MLEPVSIRDIRRSDLPTFYSHQCDPRSLEMAAFTSRDDDAFLIHWEKILADPDVDAQTVLEGDRVAGNIVCWRHGQRRLVGYWLGREFWGRGVATSALTLFLDRVGERPLWAYVTQHNRASMRVLEKCGFVLHALQPDRSARRDDPAIEFVFRLAGDRKDDREPPNPTDPGGGQPFRSRGD